MEYFSFQGGDLLPLLLLLYNTTLYTPAPHHSPTDLNTSASDEVGTDPNDRNRPLEHSRPRWVSDPLDSVLSWDPTEHHGDPVAARKLYS